MKPAWDELMKEFEGDNSRLVADVDCTSDGGKPLCEANGVRGYPTLKWGDPASLEDYSGGRDLDTLKKFATEKLTPLCSPAHLDLCDKDQQKEIKKYLEMGKEKLEIQVKEKKAEIDKAEADFKEEVEALQTKYKDMMSKKDETIEKIKSGGLSIMEKCLNSLNKKKHDEL
jgi:Thioredoxin